MTNVTKEPSSYYRTSPEGYPMGTPQEGTHLTATADHGVTREWDVPSKNRIVVGVASFALNACTTIAAKRHVALEDALYTDDK